MGFVKNLFATPDTDLDTRQGNLVQRIEGTEAQAQPLAQALMQQALTGGGPLAQVSNANLAQAQKAGAGLIASQKGINSGLAARLGAQQAGQMAQQAVAQNAQNQLAAQQLASNQNLQQQSILQGAVANQNSATAGMKGAANQAAGTMQGGLLNAAGGIGAALINKAKGGFIEGKASVEGDSYANDTVPAMLSPGEIVVPRTAAKDPEKAKAFIDELLASKSKKQTTGPKGYAKVLAKHKELADRVAKLEKGQ